MTPEQKADAIVEAIIDDLTDCKGLRHEWDNLDDDIQDEIRRGWRTIVFEHLVGLSDK